MCEVARWVWRLFKAHLQGGYYGPSNDIAFYSRWPERGLPLLDVVVRDTSQQEVVYESMDGPVTQILPKYRNHLRRIVVSGGEVLEDMEAPW